MNAPQDVRAILDLQRTVGNQFVNRMLRSQEPPVPLALLEEPESELVEPEVEVLPPEPELWSARVKSRPIIRWTLEFLRLKKRSALAERK